MAFPPQKIVVVGAGFAGLWAALSAARKLHLAGKPDGFVEIVLIAPEPVLCMRPRLYESDLSDATVSLTELLNAVSVLYVQGTVQQINVETKTLAYISNTATTPMATLTYDRLVLATGSQLFRPQNISGLAEYSWDVDQLDSTSKLDAHLKSLAALPSSSARNTVVVCGGGFTGVEIAAEMPQRLREILGAQTDVRVIVLERADTISPEMAAPPRPVIAEALASLGIVVLTGQTVASVDAEGVTTADGTRFASMTVIWTAGMRASTLTAQIPASRDSLGRLVVGQTLNVVGVESVYATGDIAHVYTDDHGHLALMSCQHAMYMGKAAGNNAMADLLGLTLEPYRKAQYSMCLALGQWGALVTVGWEQTISLVRGEGQKVKTYVNTQVIHPPPPNRVEIFAAADPDVQLKLY
ncbi:FAD-dependent pyridine nucleotide-disulfide oxidoreductase [Mycena belliarum]|uniref:FAD-dependent pyridine nucleotide-disulfide oxidoreductase n=1 Tax=Mycena belliarum TaxID=1033014 RepID=A0AAD6XWH9_9AGAR|nr:FAD-dependent pyridine nucleotide-disulfide oxidoreductase [Mycena belliae]